jgi:glycosyltransferase involved in cell wall biosynthesis
VNILFVDQFSEPGGAQLALRDLMPAILRRGWNAHIAAPGDRWLKDCEIPFHSLPLRAQASGQKTLRDMVRFTIDIPRMRAALRRIVEQHEIDLIYVNGPRVLPAVTGLAPPVLFHAHSDVGDRWADQLRLLSVRRTNAQVIAASKYTGRRFEDPVVIYNGVSDHGSGTRSFRSAKTRVSILGRIAPEKGQLDFVRAAKILGGDAFAFAVYGAAMFSGQDYAEQVRTEAAGHPIEFHGWRDNVTEVLCGTDILVVPSFAGEASTRVIMEAFSAGVPVVAYPSGGIPELIQNGVTGVLTESADFHSLARCISMLQMDGHWMRRISAASRQEWKRRFTIEGFQNAVCGVIEATCSGHDPATATVAEYHHGRRLQGSRDLPGSASVRFAAEKPGGADRP